MNRLFIAVCAGLMALAVPASAAPLKAVASFTIVGDMVSAIGGPDVQVTNLVGKDADTHTYQPTPNDAKTLAAADIIFVNGLGFEGWIDRLVKASASKAMIITVSNNVAARKMDEDGKQVTDPHAWQDVANAKIYARNIADALKNLLPEKADAIEARAKKYDAELDKLDKWVRDELATIPKEKRKIITSHDAFGYFGAAYGVEILPAQGVSTESEPTAANLAKLSEQIKKEGVKTVFLENMSSPRLGEQLAKDSGAKLGPPLYADALTASYDPAPNYIQMMKSNVAKMKSGM
jgi:zinc/manganese transport system substrate-binding protein